MGEGGIVMYGALWCSDCRRAKRYLDSHNVDYTWIDIEREPEGERIVLERNNGDRIIPTIVFPDGSMLVEPSDGELEEKLGSV